MTIKELEDIQELNRAFIKQFSPEQIYSSDSNCKKIDLYSNGNYVCSTRASKTCKLAKARLLGRNWLSYGCTKVIAVEAVQA